MKEEGYREEKEVNIPGGCFVTTANRLDYNCHFWKTSAMSFISGGSSKKDCYTAL